MYSVRGIPVDANPVWGWPWHGQLYQPDPLIESYDLLRHNGEQWPLYPSRIPSELLSKMQSYKLGVNGTGTRAGGTTHLVKTHGHLFTERTTEQATADAARSQEWLGGTMLCGSYHRLYMTELGWYHWIFSFEGKRWLMKIDVDTVPHPTSSPTTALGLTISARPFGMFGVPGEWAVVGSVSADSCCTSGFSWFGPGLTLATMPPVMLQSIRSDGGKLILEVKFWAMEPARLASGAIGFYRLDVERVLDVWGLTLTRLKKDTDVIRKVLVSNPISSGVSKVELQTTNPTPTTVLYTPTVVAGGDAAALKCTGTITQENIRHCGFVYDADDILHELECVIRVSHNCSVPDTTWTVSGSATVDTTTPGSFVCTHNDILIAEDFSSNITTTLTVEMRRDGVAVSSVSSPLTTSKEMHATRATFIEGVGSGSSSLTSGRSLSLTVGAHVVSQSISDPFTVQPSGNTRLWPDAGILSSLFFSSVAGAVVTPWPSSNRPGAVLEQPLEWRTYASNGTSTVTDGFRIRLGAARQSNNVFVPVIVAGIPGAFNQWKQLESGWAYSTINGLASCAFGQRVGPDANGLAPADFVPVGGFAQLLIDGGAYDFLHRTVTPYADIF